MDILLRILETFISVTVMGLIFLLVFAVWGVVGWVLTRGVKTAWNWVWDWMRYG